MKLGLLLGAAVAPLAIAGAVSAEEVVRAPDYNDGPVTALSEVIVTGRPVLRNRADDVVPTPMSCCRAIAAR